MTLLFFLLLQKALCCCPVAKLLGQGRKEKKHRKQQVNELNNDKCSHVPYMYLDNQNPVWLRRDATLPTAQPEPRLSESLVL